jgi:predicted metal-binding membrane protein
MATTADALLNRQRMNVALGLGVICALAWAYTVWVALHPELMMGPMARRSAGRARAPMATVRIQPTAPPTPAMPMEPGKPAASSATVGGVTPAPGGSNAMPRGSVPATTTGAKPSIAEMGSAMAMPMEGPWDWVQAVLTFIMWAVMMVAMMLPSAAPMILVFERVHLDRAAKQQPYVPTAVFAAGYLAVWVGFSVLATAAQWALHTAALLSPGMAAASPWLGGALLIAAGAFQLTPLKRACLAKCRTPLGFMLTEWREGVGGALMMGLRHGVFCTICCWGLMALLLVGGVMNLLWVAGLAIVVLGEKVLPRGELLGRIGGALLIAWGVWVAARGLR